LIPEPHNQQEHDLFMAKSSRLMQMTEFSAMGTGITMKLPEWKSLHHVAGGHYYTIGDPVDANLIQP
jgi:hypothetical protein